MQLIQVVYGADGVFSLADEEEQIDCFGVVEEEEEESGLAGRNGLRLRGALRCTYCVCITMFEYINTIKDLHPPICLCLGLVKSPWSYRSLLTETWLLKTIEIYH